MLTEILGFVFAFLPGLMFLWLVYIVTGQFERAGVKLKAFEAVGLVAPVIVIVLSLWRVSQERGVGIVRFEVALTVFLFASILAMVPTKWCDTLVMSVGDIRQDKITRRATVVIVIVTVSAMFLLVELGGLLSGLVEVAKEKWNEVPKSEQFFTYGLGVAVLAALSVFGLGTLYRNNPEQGQGVTSVVLHLLIALWAFLWIVSIFYGFLEKIGGFK